MPRTVSTTIRSLRPRLALRGISAARPDTVRTLVLTAPGAFAAWAAPGRQAAGIDGDPAGRRLVSEPCDHDRSRASQPLRPSHVSRRGSPDHPARPAVGGIRLRARLQRARHDRLQPGAPRSRPGPPPGRYQRPGGTSASVLQYTSFGETWFRGLDAFARRPSRQPFFFRVGYMLSKAEDTSTDFQSAFLPQNNGRGPRSSASSAGLPIGFRPDDERGPALHDERQRLVATGSYRIPWDVIVFGTRDGRLGLAVQHPGRDGSEHGSRRRQLPVRSRARRFPADPATSLSRNAGRLPSQISVDARVSKSVRITGRLELEGLFEVFNLFNRTNFTDVQNVFGVGAYPSNPAPRRLAGSRRQATAVRCSLRRGFVFEPRDDTKNTVNTERLFKPSPRGVGSEG